MKRQQVVGYFNGWVNKDEIEAKAESYDVLIFAFLVNPSKEPSGAAAAIISDPDLIPAIKGTGKKCIISLGGSTFNISESNAKEYGKGAAEFALKYGFDGVDFDIENIKVNDQDSLQWLADATIACANTSGADSLLISHAPQGPYFSGASGYAELEKLTNGRIDAYYIQYYNQGSWGYQSYENYASMFEETYNNGSENFANPTSILSIQKQQHVPAEKLYVGKPIAAENATNTGYIPMDKLATLLLQANQNSIVFGGVMGWAIDSDTNGVWGKRMQDALNG